MHADHGDLFERLAQSAFRAKFKLAPSDISYMQTKGIETIGGHAVYCLHKTTAFGGGCRRQPGTACPLPSPFRGIQATRYAGGN